MSEVIIGRRGLAALRGTLNERDLDVTRSVDGFRFLTASQIEDLHFTDHLKPLAGSRACRRTLERLSRDRILTRLDRRIGGVRAGSASFVYGIGPIGDRLLGGEGPRRRWREPSTGFLDHTLAIAQLVVTLIQSTRRHELELIFYETEPTCWRRFTRGLSGPETIRPDLFAAVGVGEFEDRWFVEMDLATESTTTVLRKCQTYHDYHASGVEQHRHGIFPKVLWVVPSSARERQLRRALAASRSLNTDLFEIVQADQALSLFAGGSS